MKERLYKELKILLVILSVGLLYLLFVLLTGLKIPCPIKLLTGLECPGCGITRMIVSAFLFDFAEAFKYNPVLFVTLPFLLFFLVFERIRYIKSGSAAPHPVTNYFVVFEVVLLLVFGVLRNIL